MNVAAIFGISILMSFLAFGIVTKLYIWPGIRLMRREDALIALIVPHAFRFVGLSFLVPGVVSSGLAPDFAAPAAYGDLCAAILAVVTVFSLATERPWAIPLTWTFNLWGTWDLLHAMYQGQVGVGISPGSLGAAYFIPTVIVPPLLITHGLIHWLLIRSNQAARSSSRS